MLRSARASAVLAFLALQACASMHPSVRYQAMLPAGELHILEHGEIIAECGTTHAFAWEQCAERRAPAGNDLEVVWWHLGEVVARAHVTVDEARVLGFVGLYEGSFGAVERTVAAPAAIRLAPLQPETDLFVDPTPGAHSSVSRVSLEIHNAGDVTITSDGNGYGGELAGDWFVCEAGGWLRLRRWESIGCGTGIAENPFVLAPGETRGALDLLAPSELARGRALRFAATVRPLGAAPSDARWQVEITGHVGADGRFVADADVACDR